MNWAEIAPNGTAAFCDEWRSKYHSMPYAEHQRLTDQILEAHPKQEGYDASALLECLSLIPPGPIKALEFGGWTGGLAQTILTVHRNVKLWDNYEIAPACLSRQECFYPHYHAIVPHTFVWDTPQLTEGHNLFVSSHSIEHISREHLHKLFAWLPDTIRWMFLQAPLPPDCIDNKWEGYGGTHILEDGWQQVINHLRPKFTMNWRGGIRNECLFFERNA